MFISNACPGDINDPFTVSFTYSVGASGSGTLEPYECCTHSQLPIIAAITSYRATVTGYTLPSGDVTVHALLDSGNVIDESSEDDNQASYERIVP